MVTIGNLRVLNLTALFPRYLPSLERIVPEYKRVIGDADILITDNPPNLDEICELEFKAYRLATGEAHCNSVFVTTPGIALRLTLTHMNEVPKILRTWVPDLAYAKLTALVINMVKGEVGDIPVERKVIIPFKNDLFYSGLRIGTELVEIDQLVKYAEEAIENNNSGK
ncbi:hypothetical protein [Metallosphaera hakonensis]|nr:hypothetical protein [Metallosphaera hakonensis]